MTTGSVRGKCWAPQAGQSRRQPACDGTLGAPGGKEVRVGAAGCCWRRLILFCLRTLIRAKVDEIGFDASPHFAPGDPMDRLVRELLRRGFAVAIESWPLDGRPYPDVRWVVREQRYQRILFEPRNDVPVRSVIGPIQRIIPNDRSDRGRNEIAFINTIRERHGAPPFAGTQEIVDHARDGGHTPLVTWNRLADGSVT